MSDAALPSNTGPQNSAQMVGVPDDADLLERLCAISDYPWAGVMAVELRNLIREARDEILRLEAELSEANHQRLGDALRRTEAK